MGKNYFEISYKGPFKGIHNALPEDCIPINNTPFMQNFILKNGEIRTRPRQNNLLPGTPDGNPILIITSFMDSNNIIHTVAVTSLGLWQLNRAWYKRPVTPNKTWNLIGNFTTQPGSNLPVASSVFINNFFWTNGGNNLWMWDGITSVGSPSIWPGPGVPVLKGTRIVDSNGNEQIASNSGVTGSPVHPVWSNVIGGLTQDGTEQWTMNGRPAPANGFASVATVDTNNGVTAGAYFLIELNAQLLMLNTVEGKGSGGQLFPQRIRWSPSGLPTIWDPLVNIGAGFNDELDVPDAITGAFTVGTTAFVLRNNGITEITSNGGQATNPFAFNHLWASDRGIGNIFPYGYASYGPLGIFISNDDVYNVSLGGFKKIGGTARDSIYNDLARATQNPIASIVPFYQNNYIYNHYRLAIAQGNNSVVWIYSIEDESWQKEYRSNTNYTGITRWSYTG